MLQIKRVCFPFFFPVLCPSLWGLFPETGHSGRRRISAPRRRQSSAFQASCLVFVSLHIWKFPAGVNRNCLAIVPEQTRPSETALGGLKLSASSCVVHLYPRRSPLKLPVKQSGPLLGWMLTICISLPVQIKKGQSLKKFPVRGKASHNITLCFNS